MTGITVVTLYDTLGKESIDYILNQCKIKTCVLSSDKIRVLLDMQKDGKLEFLQTLIYFDEPTKEDVELAASINIALIPYSKMIAEGRTSQAIIEKPEPETIYTLSYTSGTTGMPKGVMLTHRNFASNIAAVNHFDGEFGMKSDDIYISYLPLAHVMERLFMLASMSY